MLDVTVTDEWLARLLADSLSDRTYWRTIDEAASGSASAASLEALAQRAATLYSATAPAIVSRLTASGPEPRDLAIGTLREIADAGAMASVGTDLEPPALHVPPRGLIELLIRVETLDDWAARLGQPLSLESTLVGGERPALEEESLVGERDLAERFVQSLDWYAEALEWRNVPAGRKQLLTRDFREAAAREIDEARSWLTWSRSNADSPAEIAAVLMLYVGQAFFVIACGAAPEDELFPPADFIREAMRLGGTYGWLGGCGVEWPERFEL